MAETSNTGNESNASEWEQAESRVDVALDMLRSHPEALTQLLDVEIDTASVLLQGLGIDGTAERFAFTGDLKKQIEYPNLRGYAERMETNDGAELWRLIVSYDHLEKEFPGWKFVHETVLNATTGVAYTWPAMYPPTISPHVSAEDFATPPRLSFGYPNPHGGVTIISNAPHEAAILQLEKFGDALSFDEVLKTYGTWIGGGIFPLERQPEREMRVVAEQRAA